MKGRRMMNVGFIGLGNMGGPMSSRLLDAGHHLTVYDVREEAVARFARLGAEAVRSPKEVAQACDLLLTSLPNPKIVEEVLTGPLGALEGAKAGDIFIDLSTVDPVTIRRIGASALKKGVAVVDAPVTGGVAGATAGTLTIMAGGEPEAVGKAKQVLQAFGKNIVHVGGPGAGSIAKLINNLVAFSFTLSLAEGLILGTKAGVDLRSLAEVLGAGAARGYVFDRNMPRMVKGEYQATFTLDLACKDMQLALDMAESFSVPLFLGQISSNLMACACNAGLAQEDVCAAIKFLETVAQFSLPHPKGGAHV